MKTGFLCQVILNNAGKKLNKEKQRIILEAIRTRHFKEDILDHVRSLLR